MQREQQDCDRGLEELAISKGVDLEKELTRGFAIKYIRFKVKQLVGTAGFTASDRPDLEQDMVIHLLRRLSKFDPNIAHWNVFVKTLTERRVASVLKSRRTMKHQAMQKTVSLSTEVQDEDGEWVELGSLLGPEQREDITGRPIRDDCEQVDLAHDVGVVLAQLTPEQRDLCELLANHTPAEISRDLDIPRSTLNDRIYALRQAFEKHGLGDSP